MGYTLLIVKLFAVSFGTSSGVGLAGNFRQLITVLGVLSGAGIFNGVTKYVAEHHQDPQKLRAVLGTSSTIILGFSTLLAIVFLLCSVPISVALFDSEKYSSVIQVVALIQMGIGYSNYFLAILKGYRDASANALAIILGSIIGVFAYYLCYLVGGYEGALAGLALVPALVVLPAAGMVIKRKQFALSSLKPAWDKAIATNLGKFTVMAMLTAVTLPVAYIMMRNLLTKPIVGMTLAYGQGLLLSLMPIYSLLPPHFRFICCQHYLVCSIKVKSQQRSSKH